MQGGAGADASPSMQHSGTGFRENDDASISVTLDDRAPGSDDDDEADARAQVRSTMLSVFAAAFVGIAAVALVVDLVVRRRRGARARRAAGAGAGSVLPGGRFGIPVPPSGPRYVVQADVADVAQAKAVGIPCSESSV